MISNFLKSSLKVSGKYVLQVLQVLLSLKGYHQNTTTMNFTPKSPKSIFVSRFFKYCLKSVFFLVLSKVVFFRSYENYISRFPEGVQKKEIQQWRQARSRPGEKDALKICWGKTGKLVRSTTYFYNPRICKTHDGVKCILFEHMHLGEK